jgi:hypothetical protein
VFRSVRLLLLVALLLPAMAAVPSRAVPAQPDIIVLLTDDLRTDDWRVLTETNRLVGGSGIQISSTPRHSAAQPEPRSSADSTRITPVSRRTTRNPLPPLPMTRLPRHFMLSATTRSMSEST